jgi:hypothetical protein
MKNVLKNTIAASLLVATLNANETNHNMHIGLDSLSGDIKADFGVNLGYSYILGDDWKYGIGTNIIVANGDGETGDAFSIDARVGKALSEKTTIYTFVGASAINTGYKNSSNDDEIADGFSYGLLLNYAMDKKCDIQIGYKVYDLEYTLNSQTKDFDVQSATINYIYKF